VLAGHLEAVTKDLEVCYTNGQQGKYVMTGVLRRILARGDG
jgi:hypothetical protein